MAQADRAAEVLQQIQACARDTLTRGQDMTAATAEQSQASSSLAISVARIVALPAPLMGTFSTVLPPECIRADESVL